MKKYFFIVFFALTLFFIPKSVFALQPTQSAFALYEALGGYQLQPAYDSNWASSHNVFGTFPSNTYSLITGVDTQNGYYTFVKAMNLEIHADSNFVVGHTYTIDLTIDYGTYVTFTNYYGWEIVPNKSVSSCTGDINNCAIVWNPQNDSYTSTLSIVYRPSVSQDNFTIGIGNLGVASNFLFWNRYEQPQGFRISSITITDNGENQDVDVDEIVDQITEVNDKLDELTNTIVEQNQALLDSQRVCSNSFFTKFSNGWLNDYGSIQSNDVYFVSDYIDISGVSSLNFDIIDSNGISYGSYCFYNVNKSLISCHRLSNSGTYYSVVIPTDAFYFRSTLRNNVLGSAYFLLCKNGNQAISDSINDLNNTLTDPFDSNIGATLFPGVDWYENSHFSSIITAPISFLNSLNDSCQPVTLSLFGQNVILPCGTSIFWDLDNSYIRNFRSFWNVIFGGLIIYRLSLQLIMTINDTLDPTKDKIGGFDI